MLFDDVFENYWRENKSMRILHYSLGLYPFRTGGLAKYSTDLMEKQLELGHDVYLLYPGKMGILKRKNKIVKTKEGNRIKVFEIINPLPIPIFQGIIQINEFVKKGDIKEYMHFLSEIKPSIIHVHTLMGMHQEFLEAAKKLDIRIIYTTHDYFGICPKTVLYDGKQICKYNGMGEHCSSCNKSALPYWKMVILQSHMYKKIKNNIIISIIKKSYIKKITDKVTVEVKSAIEYVDYSVLKKFYDDLFTKIDFYHFNSETTKKIFKNYLPNIKGETINISHKNISDHRVIRKFQEDKLCITYLTSCADFKGFNILKQAIVELHDHNLDIQLNIYNDYQSNVSYIKGCGMFDYSDLSCIYDKTDLLVVPSLWNETFGFLVLEGLSYGIPVLLTENVGAKDIIKDGITGIVIEPTLVALKNEIKKIYENRELLSIMNKNILKDNINFSFDEHVNKINNMYQECNHL